MTLKFYTIGHGELPWATLVARLGAQGITVLVDGRARTDGIPEHFRPVNVLTHCAQAGLIYFYAGHILKLTPPPLADFETWAAQADTPRGLAWLLNIAAQTHLAPGDDSAALLGFGVAARGSARHEWVARALLASALVQDAPPLDIQHIDRGGDIWAAQAAHFAR